MWALDLGTTNTGLARWDESAGKPRLVQLNAICRKPDGDDALQAPRLVPSATHLLKDLSFWTELMRKPFFARRFFVGQYAEIGRPALDLNQTRSHAEFVPVFKPYLGREPLRQLGKLGGRPVTAREVGRTFVRELLRHTKLAEGERIRELVITTPVDSYEVYRAELTQIAKALGIWKLRFIDEPVAAAIGYGLALGSERLVLVVDFGGGTLDIALVAITAKGAGEGGCRVIAKDGRPIGGGTVDEWLLEEFCRELGFHIDEDTHDWERGFWRRMALAEARRVKERLFFNETELFRLTPPESMRNFEARVRGEAEPLRVSKESLLERLKARGLYDSITACVEDVLEQARVHGIRDTDIEDVLMVGGSTLLPNVYPMFEERFGRTRVRAFQPFEAVAYGACAFSAGQFTQSDYIVHDYAIVTHDPKTHQEQYITIVPRGTRFPTPTDFWRRRLVPTCSLGEPESMFKLVVCEIGRDSGEDRRFAWDKSGNVKQLGGTDGSGETRLVVPLNESNPTLGELTPPQSPSDRAARLDVQFSVNSDRWLCATVNDLKTGKRLMDGEAVVRLL